VVGNGRVETDLGVAGASLLRTRFRGGFLRGLSPDGEAARWTL
jgi:hypothetical protein